MPGAPSGFLFLWPIPAGKKKQSVRHPRPDPLPHNFKHTPRAFALGHGLSWQIEVNDPALVVLHLLAKQKNEETDWISHTRILTTSTRPAPCIFSTRLSRLYFGLRKGLRFRLTPKWYMPAAQKSKVKVGQRRSKNESTSSRLFTYLHYCRKAGWHRHFDCLGHVALGCGTLPSIVLLRFWAMIDFSCPFCTSKLLTTIGQDCQS